MPAVSPGMRLSEPTLPLVVTMGDPNGIRPDIILASWHARTKLQLPAFAVFGDAATMRSRARSLNLDVPLASLTSLSDTSRVYADALPMRHLALQKPNDIDAAIVATIEGATDAVLSGQALALVTNPIAKKSLQAIPLEYPGHTAFLGLLASRYHHGRHFQPTMMLVADVLKVVPATVHIPVSAIANTLTKDLVLQTIRTTATTLVQDFGILQPRIAVAGLNPHAGEGGLIGKEEAAYITPAITEASADGIRVTGPHSADTLFHAEARATYDAVVAMYHDQALIPLKTLAFDDGVNVTLGLPFVRTSPDHGTAFDLAGTGRARPHSFIAALRLADLLGKRRAAARRPASP